MIVGVKLAVLADDGAVCIDDTIVAIDDVQGTEGDIDERLSERIRILDGLTGIDDLVPVVVAVDRVEHGMYPFVLCREVQFFPLFVGLRIARFRFSPDSDDFGEGVAGAHRESSE